jgi:surface antigen
MSSFTQKIAIFITVLSLASACHNRIEPEAEPVTTEAATIPPPLTVDDVVAAASAANARAASETLITKVSNRSISVNQWQDIFVMQNATFDRTATYMARLYVYTTGAKVDLYASDFIGGGWRVLAQNTSTSFPQKEITFQLRYDTAETRIKVFGSRGSNVKFDLALYKVSNPVQKISWSTSSTNQTNLAFGSIYGYIGNTAVYSNGPKYTSTTRSYLNGVDLGYQFQCVEMVRRFYYQFYNKQMGAGYNALNFYGNAWRWGMTAYANGGGMAPKPGDVLCFNGNAGGGYGHVAIIVEVGSDYIIIGQQNVYKDTHVGKKYSRSGNTVNASHVQGWIRL